MMFYFSERSSEHIIDEKSEFPAFVLSRDAWNDAGYVTGFILKYYETYDEYVGAQSYHIGLLKIGKKGMEHDDDIAYLKNEVNTELPGNIFKILGEDYFSLGQDISYYNNIVRKFNLEERETFFTALRDVAFSEEYFNNALGEKVLGSSLLRNSSKISVENELRNLIHGSEGKSSEYELKLIIEKEVNNTPFLMKVIPNSLPQSNLHALIGRNGVGKSFFFKSLVSSLSNHNYEDDEVGVSFFKDIYGVEEISSIIAIDLSVFDSTMPKESIDADPLNNKLRYTFVGFPFERNNLPTDEDSIKEKYADLNIFKKGRTIESYLIMEFRQLSIILLKRESQLLMLSKALNIVESDPMFKENRVHEWFLSDSEESDKTRLKNFYKLSSGHKICLLMLMEMVLNIEINSLVLIDEPELHLHPPLLSSLIQAINYLLVTKNAIALVATHSPVVLQEISSDCVWIMEREVREIKISRPDIKTFGANINELTRAVFKLEVENSGYEKLIKDVMLESESIEQTFVKFDNQLSENAKLMIAATWGYKK